MSEKILINEQLAERIHEIVHTGCVGLVDALTEAGVNYSRHFHRLQTAEPYVESMVRGYCDSELREFNEFVAKSEGNHA